MVLLAVASGLFVVPLYAAMQQRSDAREKGRVVAANNFYQTIGMLLASVLLWGLHDRWGIGADTLLLGAGILTLLATQYIVTVVPDFVANAATNGWAWWVALGQVGPAPADAFARIESAIGGTTLEMLDRAAAGGLPPREAARRIARDRLDRLAAEHGVEGPV